MKKYADIIERIEYLRNYLGLNKSRFSASIGMKPQTYNNFIGAQGSKPNVELLLGIVNTFGVNPMWLLNGTGAMFSSTDLLPGVEAEGRPGELHEAGVADAPATAEDEPQRVMRAMHVMQPIMDRVEAQLAKEERPELSALTRFLSIVRRYHELAPAEAMEECRLMLQRLEARIVEPEDPEA